MNTFENTKEEIQKNLHQVKHKLLVLSGKGGVGKSSIATNLALGLAKEGFEVGILDIDVHGPSVPTMLGLVNEKLTGPDKKIIPVRGPGGLKVVSTGFLLESIDSPVIWRGPRKMAIIQSFLTDIVWGKLDYLIIDSPPGTGDEPLSIAELLGTDTKAIIVSTPQNVALTDVRKSLSFCRELGLETLGVVLNMAQFQCQHCGNSTRILPHGSIDSMLNEHSTSLLAEIPFDPELAIASDQGVPVIISKPSSLAAVEFNILVKKIIELEHS